MTVLIEPRDHRKLQKENAQAVERCTQKVVEAIERIKDHPAVEAVALTLRDGIRKQQTVARPKTEADQ